MNKKERYNWTEDPKHYRVDGLIPMDRCSTCGFRYIGWNLAFPFCNICYLEQCGNMPLSEKKRDYINSHARIPEDMSELDYVIREKKREAERIYNQKKNPQPVQSDFKRAIDLA